MSTIATINPATEKEIQTYQVMTEREATDRLEACYAAFLEWRQLTHKERAPYLRRIAQKLRDNADELAVLMTNETGNLLQDGHLEVGDLSGDCDYTADKGPEVLADEERAFRLARDHFDTGMIRINSFGAADPNMPFGGVKDSGYGREHGACSRKL